MSRTLIITHLKQGLKLSVLYQLILSVAVLALIKLNVTPFVWSEIRSRFGAWDGDHYISVAMHGYQTVGDPANFIAFYPLYPLLIQLNPISSLTPYGSAILLTILTSVAGHALFFVWLKQLRIDQMRVLRILFLFFVTPVAVYFTHVYTEGLFLLLTAAFLVLLWKRQFFLAAMMGLLASSTRLVGTTLIIPYLFFFFEEKLLKTEVKKILYVFLIPLGFILYLGINTFLFGNPFHYQAVLRDNWYKEAVNPVSQYLLHLTNFDVGKLTDTSPSHFITTDIDIIATLIFPAIIVLYVILHKGKVRWSLVVWSIAQFMIVCAQSFWLSNTRYIALILPLYIMLEEILWKWKILYFLACIGCAVLALYGIDLFTKGAWLY